MKNDFISKQDAIDAAIEAVDEWDGGHNLTREDMIAEAINNTVTSAEPRIHVKTIEDLFDIFEPYLSTEDLQECLEEMKKADMRGEQDE